MLDSGRLLDQILTDPKAKFLLRMTIRSIEDALRIASALHDYTGSNIRASLPINLSDLVYRSQPLIHGLIPEGSVVHYSLPKELPDIVGDPVKLEQCLFTLVLNAVESYGDRNGPVWVGTNCRKLTPQECSSGKIGNASPEGSYVLLETRDQGCGMDERLLMRIFDPFFSTKFLGRGLGLSAVAGIVRSHNGAILVNTAPGHGTCIRLCFPVVGPRV
jgi:signal transduction histidine kinase